MRCYDCLQFKVQEIDMPEFIYRFGEDKAAKIFHRKEDKLGRVQVYWCKKRKLPREFYVESQYITRLKLPGCLVREVEEGEE